MATRLDLRDNGGMVLYTYTLRDRLEARAVAHSTLVQSGYEPDDVLCMVDELDREGWITALSRKGMAVTYRIVEDVTPPHSLTYSN